MPDEDEPTQHCQLPEQIDLLTALNATPFEHLEVDEQRRVVIYQSAILMLIVTDGHATAVREFAVELWKAPVHNPARDPNDILTTFVDELLASTDTTCR